MSEHAPHAKGIASVLRHRDGHHAKVTFEELFFDLVYAFAVTQLSHKLLHALSLRGLMETVLLWFAVWLGWQYTCWFTNWFDPERPRVRGGLFATMFLALLMAAAIPQAFGERGWVFGLALAAMQVGRTALVLWMLPAGHPLQKNHQRMLGWLTISACFWVAGGLAEHDTRMVLWLVAVLCEYLSPMTGFALPGLGRSVTRDWTIEGGHLAERCQSFVIVALGETLLATGAVFADAQWNAAVVSALLATVLGTFALWWLYFGTSSKDATATILATDDPGRMGANFHYIHAILIAGMVGCAVGNDLIMAHPHAAVSATHMAVLIGGPVVYLLGSAIYKRLVYGRIPRSHLLGALVLGLLALLTGRIDMLTMGWVTTVVLLAIAWWDIRHAKR